MMNGCFPSKKLKSVHEYCLVLTVKCFGAAVANAIYHATGKRVRDLPITPDKRWYDIVTREFHPCEPWVP
jgi:hypothetical protein